MSRRLKYQNLVVFFLISGLGFLVSACQKSKQKGRNIETHNTLPVKTDALLNHNVFLPSPDCQRIHNAGYDYLQLDPESEKLIQVGPVYWDTAPEVRISKFLKLSKANQKIFRSVRKFVPISLSNSPAAIENEHSGISIFTYSRQTGVADFKYPKDLKVKLPHPPDIAVFSDFFADASFFWVGDSFLGYKWRVGHGEIARVIGNTRKTDRRLNMPMIEYYRTNYIEGVATLKRVNCYINVDYPEDVGGYLKECLIRSMGLLQTSDPVDKTTEEKEKSILTVYLDTRPSEFSEDIKFESSLSGRCLAEKYGANK